MAKAKVVVGDQNSREFDELRKTVHTILLLLETLNSTAVTDAGTLLAAAQAIGNAVNTGVTAAGLGSREVCGVVPKVKFHPLPSTNPNLVPLVATDKAY